VDCGPIAQAANGSLGFGKCQRGFFLLFSILSVLSWFFWFSLFSLFLFSTFSNLRKFQTRANFAQIQNLLKLFFAQI
jgi:hypothetical protein